MFSAIGANAVTRTGSSSSAMARIALTTLAAPAMSIFIVVIDGPGLIDRPPES